jgi:hypothetical protein
VLVENSVQSKKVLECEEGKARTLRGLVEAKGYKGSTRRIVATVKCGETPCASLSRTITLYLFQAARRS